MIVYRHRRLDTNEIFYIGIGKTEKRATNKSNRSEFWKRIVSKTDYSVEIVTTCETWEEACQIEQYLIKYYGRRDLGLGNLVNFTDGGEGILGHKHSEESKAKISEARKGQKFSEESKTKMSKAHTGKKLSEETKLKISNNSRGRIRSLEHSQKLSESKKGKKLSEEHKANISKAIKGRLAPNRKKVICTITGFIWDSIKECANHNNINYHTLKNKLNGRLINNTNFIIYG